MWIAGSIKTFRTKRDADDWLPLRTPTARVSQAAEFRMTRVPQKR
jgi:hypothetical protein